MQRINKFPNPRFSLNGTRPAWNTDTMRHSDLNGIPRLSAEHVTTGADIYMWPIRLDAGDYHFQVVTQHATPCNGCVIWESADGQKVDSLIYDDGVKDARNAVLQSCDFTVKSADPWVMIGFTTGESGAVGQCDAVYWNPLLELSSTFADRGGCRDTSTARPCRTSANLQHGFEVVA